MKKGFTVLLVICIVTFLSTSFAGNFNKEVFAAEKTETQLVVLKPTISEKPAVEFIQTQSFTEISSNEIFEGKSYNNGERIIVNYLGYIPKENEIVTLLYVYPEALICPSCGEQIYDTEEMNEIANSSAVQQVFEQYNEKATLLFKHTCDCGDVFYYGFAVDSNGYKTIKVKFSDENSFQVVEYVKPETNQRCESCGEIISNEPNFGVGSEPDAFHP